MMWMHGSILLLLGAAPDTVPAPSPPEWSRLPALPDRNGFAGAFAGVSGGALLLAGGANFPDRKPWEGGRKVWSDAVFVLDRPGGEWKAAGTLPRRLGYGVSVTHRGSVVCAGGSDESRHYADAFRLEYAPGKFGGKAGGKILAEPLPPLPKPLAYACGERVGDVLYVAGGQEKPDAAEASAAVYAMDLSAAEPRWREIEPCPGGGRILALAADCDGAFWVAGGAALVAGTDGKPARRYLSDVHRYDPGRGWKRVADLPRPVAAAPSPAPADASYFYVLGGDDGSQVGLAPERHHGFGGEVLRYDAKSDQWSSVGRFPAAAVTTPVVRWAERRVVPSGEVRPGVRSPDVWGWAPDEKRLQNPRG